MVESRADEREDRKRREKRGGGDKEHKEIKKLKRHNATVLAVYSPNGIDGKEIVSCTADHIVRSK